MEDNNIGLEEVIETKKKRRFGVGDVIFYSIILILLILSLTRTVVISQVIGESMEPTLHNSDTCIVVKDFDGYEPGDIVVFNSIEDKALIKRVIAVGGQTVRIADGIVYVNDVAIEEDYLKEGEFTVGFDIQGTVIVPKGCYFVLGDNRNNSLDSRSKTVGFIKETDMIGESIFHFNMKQLVATIITA